jgi:hypothetical protein
MSTKEGQVIERYIPVAPHEFHISETAVAILQRSHLVAECVGYEFAERLRRLSR